MKISIAKKKEHLTEDDLDNYNIIDKENYSSIIFFLKVPVALSYAFGLGYSLFFLGDDYIHVGKTFLALLIISYIFIEFPYAFIKALFLPKVLKKDNINLEINPFTMAINIKSKIKISKVRIIFSLIVPCILFAVIPTIASYMLEFNIYLYAIASSAAIISVKDIIYLLILIKNNSLGSYIKLESNEFIFYQ
ncbi:MAG: DUF3267 domain-containing protein [Clostridium sp.]|mgnify:CR=1 FL=1|uniref:metalloprotease family protein n=1 Tax=Clostridium sp. TaxID=1506 RepID=UPI0025C0EA72|nr:metalloprotease family protein [Clostridium sp.]MCF0148496.1 DUF3267 domain-containing protein [Clostridium sp.]